MDAPGGDVLGADAELAESIETEVLQAEERRCVRRAVLSLPEKYRIVILLFYMEELSIEEISAVQNIPKGTVKSRLHQARKLLKQQLEVLLYE